MDEKLRRYALGLTTDAGSASYETKYDRELHKRISNRAERRVIARAFELAPGPYARALDVPCGAGRLTPHIAPNVAGSLVEADYSPNMLARARATARARGEDASRRYVRLDALSLPFQSASFDLVFSARLSHHIANDADRDRWLLELCRVSRAVVIATIFDHYSLKNLLRLVRAPFSRKRAKSTLKLARVHELADRAGFELRAALPLSRLFSGHRYLVMTRRGR